MDDSVTRWAWLGEGGQMGMPGWLQIAGHGQVSMERVSLANWKWGHDAPPAPHLPELLAAKCASWNLAVINPLPPPEKLPFRSLGGGRI